MQLTVLTEDLLLNFKNQLLSEIKDIMKNQQPIQLRLKSQDVRRILGCSESTLATIRKNGKLAFTQVGVTYYYKPEHVENLLNGISNESS